MTDAMTDAMTGMPGTVMPQMCVGQDMTQEVIRHMTWETGRLKAL
jgi:hypothetical protein